MLFFASAQNYYEVPYVGIKSKLTKLAGSELTSFVKENNIPAEYISHADEKDVGGFFNDLRNLPAKLAAIYKEDVPDENGKITLTVYRAMYKLLEPDNETEGKKIKITFDAWSKKENDTTERQTYGQKVYVMNSKNDTIELFLSCVYFGDQFYLGISRAYGVQGTNVQFRIEGDSVLSIVYTLDSSYQESGAPDNPESTYSATNMAMMYKDKLGEITKKTKLYEVSGSENLLDKNNPYKYAIQNAFDGDPSTSYVEDTEDNGIDMHFKNPYTDEYGPPKGTTKVSIINGYAANEELYKANNRIRTVCFLCYKGYGVRYHNKKYIYSGHSDSKFTQIEGESYASIDLPLDDMCLTTQIISLVPNGEKVRLLTAFGWQPEYRYLGKLYNDTCLAELDFFVNGHWLFGE